MDRRATLATLLGKKKKIKQATRPAAPLTGLEPYTGTWGFEQAAHLLRRTIYGATYEQIKTTVDNGLAATLTQLLTIQPLPDPPVNPDFTNDPNVSIGATWIDAPYSITINVKSYRIQSLYAWTSGLMLNQGISLREKMVLFWHNHFAISDINDPKFVYRYSNLLRENALGNFRELAKSMTIDPAMLRYLNGNLNTESAPNENYARELLELFTIGKGELAGPGDYTNYTEDDVIAMARVLTGWKDFGFNAVINIPYGAEFNANKHDTGDKQLSPRFDNIVITNGGDQEYANLIDIIFQKEEVARFICRKLYRWFVFYEITEETETNVIEPMAQILIDNDYNISPAIHALLNSSHFYDAERIGCMIKNPMDFVFGMINEFKMEIPTTLAEQYTAWEKIAGVPIALQMYYYNLPSVAGWKAYYQEPSYYQLWINSVTLPLRTTVAGVLLTTGIGIPGIENPKIDPLEFLDSLDNPSDINSVIAEFVKILFAQPISANQIAYLKSILIPGLPDFEWNVEYSEYASDPTNPTLQNSIRNKAIALTYSMMTMPEYQLS